MPTLTPEQIFQICLDVGFTPDQAVTWTAIAMAESGGNTGAHNPNGEDSRGLWQVNIDPNVRTNPWGDLTDPHNNARAAFEISNGGQNMSPWTVTHDRNRGSDHDYRNYLDDARAASGGEFQGDNRGVTGYGGGPSTPGVDADGVGDFGPPGVLDPPGGPDALDAPSGSGVDAFLEHALAQTGDSYVFGHETEVSDLNPETFDCCLAAGSLVATDRGAVPIEEIEPGDTVLSWGAGGMERRKVVAALDQGEQDVHRLRMRNRAVVATANHPFLVLRRDPGERVGVPVRWWTEWTRLDAIKRGDLVVTLDHADPSGDDVALSDGTPVTEDVAWLLGALVGDGTVRRSDVRLCLDGNTRERARRIIEQTWHLPCDDHESAGLLVRRNTALSQVLLDALGRRSAADNRVPSLVWRLTPARTRAFLEGYADADGHTDRRGYRSYHSASLRLVAEVRMLHVLLGDSVSNLTTHERTEPITIKGKLVQHALPLHSFQMHPDSSRHQQTVLDSYGARRAVPDRRFSVERVLGIEPAGSASTWDIEVEGAHNFVADGVVVHNSELVQWAAGQVGVEITDGSWLQYRALEEQGAAMSVEEALNTPGALLFSFSSDPLASGERPSSAHVAISLGDGTTIEARGTRYGVGTFEAGDRFQYAAVIPELGTATAGLTAAATATDTDGDMLEDALEMSRGTDPGLADTDADGLLDGFEVAIGTDALRADTDSDGLDDSYELSKSHTNALSADTDSDGVSDNLELAAGTDAIEGAVFSLSGGAAGSTTAGALGLTAEVDTDGDGLSDAKEATLGSNAADADSDRDGLNDGLELTAGTNLVKADSDSDGLSDSFELSLGLDPLKADSDNDGLFDGAELAGGSDPLVSALLTPAGGGAAGPGGGTGSALAPSPTAPAPTTEYESVIGTAAAGAPPPVSVARPAAENDGPDLGDDDDDDFDDVI